MRVWSAENPYYMMETSLHSVKIGFDFIPEEVNWLTVFKIQLIEQDIGD
jgi:hypothetical protein